MPRLDGTFPPLFRSAHFYILCFLNSFAWKTTRKVDCICACEMCLCIYKYIESVSPGRIRMLPTLSALIAMKCSFAHSLIFFLNWLFGPSPVFFFFFLSRIVVLLRMHSKGNVKPFLSVSVFVIIYVVSSLYHTNAQWNKRRRARGFGREEKRR